MKISNLKAVFLFVVCGLTLFGKCGSARQQLFAWASRIVIWVPDFSQTACKIEWTGYPIGEMPVSPSDGNVLFSAGESAFRNFYPTKVMWVLKN